MKNKTLDEWNTEVMLNLLPDSVLLLIYLILGLCGNSIVVIVYKFQMKEITEERYFIPVLAVFDLITAVYCSIYGIIYNSYHVNFSTKVICQTAHFFVGFTTFIPILIMIIIAIQRYLKVCKPLKPAMTLSLKRILIMVSICVSFLVALPIPFVYGIVDHTNPKDGLTGMRCGKIKDDNKLVRTAYGTVIGLFACIVAAVLIVLYTKIGLTVYRQLKAHRKHEAKKHKDCLRQSDSITTDLNESAPVTNGAKQTSYKNETGKMENVYASGTGNQRTSEVNNIGVVCSIESFSKSDVYSGSRTNTNRRITNKLTMMFVIITFVFLFSYFPKIVLLMLEGIYSDFWEELSDTQRPGVMFVYQMYIWNNTVNPFIYAYMDFKFRIETRNFFIRICRNMQTKV